MHSVCVSHIWLASLLRYRLQSVKMAAPKTSLLLVSRDSSLHDPLAQQTSSLKCLSGLTPRVWIAWSVCYIICLQERCGLSFLFFPPQLSIPHTYLRLSVFQNQCICRRFHCGLWRRDSDCDGFACFLNWAMCKRGREKKKDSGVLRTATGL